MQLRHDMYSLAYGVRKVKTKMAIALSVTVIGATSFLSVIALSLAPAAAIGGSYNLYGDASTVSGGNPGTAVQMLSNTTNPDGGINFAVPSGLTFGQLKNLGTDYKIIAGDCDGGSPRFQVNTTGGNIFVYIGPAPNYTGCTLNTWVSSGNLLDGTRTVDTSQIGGVFYDTYANAIANYGNLPVTGIQLVTDGGWAFPSTGQAVLVDNTQINATTYTYEPVPTKDSCKDNGWKTMTSPGPFKNQGDCVSFFATNGKNQPNGQ